MSPDRHVYDYDADPAGESAPAKVARLVGPGKRVLELGAGPGSVSKLLTAQGCRVTALERDASALPLLAERCERALAGDLGDPGWPALVAPFGPYDAVVLADVLEHLVDPWAALAAAKDLLAEGGRVVISLPHAGHNSVAASLLGGDFEYRDWGLLDRTHLRFFGLRNVEDLVSGAGLKIAAAEFVTAAPEKTELAPHWARLPAALREGLARRPSGDVYQVVLAAVPVSAPGAPVSLTAAPATGVRAAAPQEKAAPSASPRLVAFYLPQFHPIPENDDWWGPGFTEWTNAAKARPLFAGHYQPHLPGEFGFYDLRLAETRRAQIAAAKAHGIDAFCYHYYWFGGKRLLERPLFDMLEDPASDMPFCLCWANENWTRRWDASEHEVLIEQRYDADSDLDFIQDAAQFLRDPRYLRLDGKVFLVVYRPQNMPEPRRTLDRWRVWCRENGIGELHLCAALTHGNDDYASMGFDSGVEFPPHNLRGVRHDGLLRFHAPFRGVVVGYEDVARSFLERARPDRRVHMTVFPSWDNTARTGERALVVLDGTPRNYERWLSETLRVTRERPGPGEKLVFVNAWNEWAEGCHLEPDRRYGRAFLEATRRAKDGVPPPAGFESSFPRAPEAPANPRPDADRGGSLRAWIGRNPAIEAVLRSSNFVRKVLSIK